MARRRKSSGPLDTLAFYEEIGAWRPPAGYNGTDRYRDFRKVFMGSDAGKRVLNQIFDWCGLLRSPVQVEKIGGDAQMADRLAVDATMTFVKIGEQNVARRLLSTMAAIPQGEALPEKAQSEPD